MEPRVMSVLQPPEDPQVLIKKNLINTFGGNECIIQFAR
jgi:hypothetical protein